MRIFLPCFAAILLCAAVSLAQTIPNAGFETWSAGNPTGWYTSNISGFLIPVTQSSSPHTGSSALQGTVISAFGSSAYPPLVESGDVGQGFPVNSRPAALHGWYKFTPDSGDVFYASVTLQKSGAGVGGGVYISSTSHSVYTEFVANISYSDASTPDTANIFLLLSNNTAAAHVGSTFIVDDLSFGAVTAVRENGNSRPGSFVLDQNYPNPFNPTTKIQFQIPNEQFVTLKVYNVLGREVATLVNDRLQAGRYRAEFDAKDLPSGMYIYRLQTGNYSETKKLTVLK